MIKNLLVVIDREEDLGQILACTCKSLDAHGDYSENSAPSMGWKVHIADYLVARSVPAQFKRCGHGKLRGIEL